MYAAVDLAVDATFLLTHLDVLFLSEETFFACRTCFAGSELLGDAVRGRLVTIGVIHLARLAFLVLGVCVKLKSKKAC